MHFPFRRSSKTRSEYRWYQDRSAFGSALTDLRRSVEQWPERADLLDSRNLAFGRLVNEQGYRRKPWVRLATTITTRHNLVLEWWPHNPNVPFGRETNSFTDAASHPEQCGLKSLDQRIMIMIATMIATITAAMMKSFKGLQSPREVPSMDRSMPNLVPSGTKYMPTHFGHFPGFG